MAQKTKKQLKRTTIFFNFLIFSFIEIMYFFKKKEISALAVVILVEFSLRQKEEVVDDDEKKNIWFVFCCSMNFLNLYI